MEPSDFSILLKCINCNSALNPENAIDDIKNHFTKIFCEKCSKTTFFYKCNCGKIVKLKTQYHLGEEIYCNCCKKIYQFVVCPNCQSVLYWNNGIYMQGKQIFCSNCNKNYQHINCLKCFSPNFFLSNLLDNNNNYNQGIENVCKLCKSKLQFLNCPFCGCTNFIENYLQGNKIKFIKYLYNLYRCKNCCKCFQHFNCVNCGVAKYFKNEKFFYLKNYQCDECKLFSFFFPCFFCKKINRSFSLINSNVKKNNFKCGYCGKENGLIECKKCKGVISAQIEKNFCKRVNCIDCKEKFRILHCSNCSHLKICLSSVNRLKIDHNKLHFCEDCKKNEMTINNLLQNFNQIKNNQINKNEEVSDKFKCKICLDKEISRMFSICKHACVCESCGNKINKCPICRKVSKNEKFYI